MPPKKLPKHEPQTAGKELIALTSAVFLNGKTRGAASELARRLYPEKYNSRISTVAGWCRGEFLDDRGRMTPDDFQQMMSLFWKQPNGIQSVEEILDLARCVGKVKFGSEVRELADVLDSAWLSSLGLPAIEHDNHLQVDHRYPRNVRTVLRTAFLEEVFARSMKAAELRRPLVIYGQAGTGKSTLVEQLTKSKPWQSLDHKRVFFLNGQGIHLHLRAWYQELFEVPPSIAMRQDDLVQKIRESLAAQKTQVSIILDDVASVEYVSVFMEILKKTSGFTLIVTTSSPAVQKEIGVPELLRMTLGGFSADEARIYFKMLMGRALQKDEEADFRALVTELKGNPLGLHFALLLSDLGMRELLGLLHGSDLSVPSELLREVFLPLQLNFERMPAELARKFRMLGAMKRFYALDEDALAALWGYTAREKPNTRLTISEMQKVLSPFQPFGDGWRLHQQTRLFAMDKFQGLEKEEREFAAKWVERAERFYPSANPAFAEAIQTFRTRGVSRENPRSKQVSLSRWIQGTLQNTFLILGRNHSIDWQDLQAEISQMTAREYVIGSQIQRKDSQHIRQIRWWLGGLAIGLALQYFPVLDGLFSLVALAVMGFTVKVFAVDLPGYVKNMARWLNLWAEVNARIKESQMEQKEGR